VSVARMLEYRVRCTLYITNLCTYIYFYINIIDTFYYFITIDLYIAIIVYTRAFVQQLL